MNKEEDKDVGRTTRKLSVMHDLYLDILGSLIPGLLTVILGGTAIFLMLSTFHVALFQAPMFPSAFPGGMAELLASLHWEFATVIIVSSYVIGAVFFRQDPKVPDMASALHIWMNSTEKERKGLAVQATKPLPSSLMLTNPNDRPSFGERLRASLSVSRYIRLLGLDTPFPYLHLRCYLAARGLNHLIKLVPWCPNEKNTEGFRTKMLINVLKVRLLSFLPHLSHDIIRNEAHVRLATSVWYASTALQYLSGAVLSLLTFIAIAYMRNRIGSALFVSSAFSLLLLIFCVAMRHYLLKCIHYMRLREVVYVLEVANMAAQTSGAELFADLISKDRSIKCQQCEQIIPASL